MVTPNKIKTIEKDPFYNEMFGDLQIPDYEAERSFVVIQEKKEFDQRTGRRVSEPKLVKHDGDDWLQMTRQTEKANKDFGGIASTGQGGMNPLSGYSIEVIHDPYLYVSKGKEEPKKEVEEEFKYSLEDLEGLDEDATKTLYEKVARKKAGRLSIEKQREYLVENADQ